MHICLIVLNQIEFRIKLYYTFLEKIKMKPFLSLFILVKWSAGDDQMCFAKVLSAIRLDVCKSSNHISDILQMKTETITNNEKPPQHHQQQQTKTTTKTKTKTKNKNKLR